MRRPHRRGLRLRIIVLGMTGYTAQAVAHLTGCSEVYAQQVLQMWRADCALEASR